MSFLAGALAGAFFFAGAQAFCAEAPGHPLCARAEAVREVELTPSRIALLERLAREGVRNYRRDPPGVDLWAVVDPDRPGDCKKRALWAAQEIYDADPEMAGAIMPVSYSELDADGHVVPGRSHLTLIIRTDAGLVFLDSLNDAPRLGSESDLFAAPGLYLAPAGSIAGRWLRLVPQPQS